MLREESLERYMDKSFIVYPCREHNILVKMYGRINEGTRRGRIC